MSPVRLFIASSLHAAPLTLNSLHKKFCRSYPQKAFWGGNAHDGILALSRTFCVCFKILADIL